MQVRKTYTKLDSKYLKKEIEVGLVIPKAIDKVVVLLHGYDGSFNELARNLPLEEYSSERNMLIVTPNMDNRYYIDRSDFNVSRFVAEELVGYIIEQYSLDRDIKKYIAGISMGGYGSMLIGAKYIEVFAGIISISGAFIANDVYNGNEEVVGNPYDEKLFNYFLETFSPFDTLRDCISRNPIAAVIHSSSLGRLPNIIVTCGKEDMLYKRNLEMLKLFDDNKINYDWREIESTRDTEVGKHSYKCFSEGLRYAFEKVDICR